LLVRRTALRAASPASCTPNGPPGGISCLVYAERPPGRRLLLVRRTALRAASSLGDRRAARRTKHPGGIFCDYPTRPPRAEFGGGLPSIARGRGVKNVYTVKTATKEPYHASYHYVTTPIARSLSDSFTPPSGTFSFLGGRRRFCQHICASGLDILPPEACLPSSSSPEPGRFRTWHPTC